MQGVDAEENNNEKIHGKFVEKHETRYFANERESHKHTL
jgi:hypothetical protein